MVNKIATRFTAPLFALLVFVALAAFKVPRAEAHESFADLSQQLLPSVVNISTTQQLEQQPMPSFPPDSPFHEFFRDFFGENLPQMPAPPPGERRAQSLGSGFIISADGYIVTNNHVVGKAEEIEVVLQDERKFKAELVGRDAKTDLALLKIEAKKPLPFAKFGDSSKARVGDWVIAIGNPFGLGGTVTAGIISARSRDIQSGPYDDFIQTDAPINRGNSGGPLFNLAGEVIAINAVILSPGGGNVGIGFAISSNLAEPILQQLKKYGQAKRGWLGVRIQEVTPEIAEALGLKKPQGVLIAAVNEGEPAEKAGIKVGDVILEFAGKPIDSVKQLRRVVADTTISEKVTVKVWRDGIIKDFTAQVGDLEAYEEVEQARNRTIPNATQNALIIEELGIKLAPLTTNLKTQNQMPPESQGVYVADIKKDSPAQQAGLMPGEAIVEIDRQKVNSPEVAVQLLMNGNKIKLLLVRRGKQLRFATIQTTK